MNYFVKTVKDLTNLPESECEAIVNEIDEWSLLDWSESDDSMIRQAINYAYDSIHN